MTKSKRTHKTKYKHMASKTESLAMCETGHEHAANKETHKPRVHTKHDKHESTQPVKNKKVQCHAEQDKTRESKTKATNAHGQSSARPRANSIHETRTEPETRQECRDSYTMLQHKTEHVDKRARCSSTLEAVFLPENKTRKECQGSVTKP